MDDHPAFSHVRLQGVRRERQLAEGRAHWSVDTVAEKLGVSDRTVRRWEDGTRQPDVETLRALCELFTVEASYFLPQPVSGPKLSHLRMRRFLTTTAVAERLNVAKQTYSAIELGNRSLNAERAEYLAQLYGVTPDEIRRAYLRAKNNRHVQSPQAASVQ